MRLARGIQQDVTRLDVSMHDAVLVCIMNRTCQLRDEFHRAPNWHWPAFDSFIESAAFDQAHAEVATTVALTDFMNRNDERVVQTSGSFCLKAETPEVCFRGPMSGTQDF